MAEPFRPPEKLGVLEFPEDSEYHGLEMTFRLAPIDMATYYGWLRRWEETTFESEEDATAFFGDFVEQVLVEWNYAPEGEILPASRDSVGRAPIGLWTALFREWQNAVLRVAVPLGSQWRDGVPSRAPSTREQTSPSPSRSRSRRPK